MAQANCPAAVGFCCLRIGRLNSAGSVPAGATNSYVSTLLGKLTLKPVVHQQADVDVVDGCGGLPFSLHYRSFAKRYDLELDILTPDPEIHEMLLLQPLILAGSSYGVRVVSDVSTTVSQPALTSAATAQWSAADVGAAVSGTGVAGGATIISITSPTVAVMSLNATASTTALVSPVISSTSTLTTGGTLAAATYGYKVSAINAAGETLASAEVAQVVPAGTATNTVTVNWASITGATGYKIYGRATGAELLIAAVGVLAYTDTGAITPAGALPAANTTGAAITVTRPVPAGMTAATTIGSYAPQLTTYPQDFGVSLEVWSKCLIGGGQAQTLPWYRWGVFQTWWEPSDKTFDTTAMPVKFMGFGIENPGFGTGPGRDWQGGAVGVTPSRAWGYYRDYALPISACGYTAVTGPIT